MARVLEDLGYVRQLNEGVSRIYESMEKSLLAKPEYREQNNNVYLTLRNRVTAHEKTVSTATMVQIEKEWTNYNDTQKAILLYLFTMVRQYCQNWLTIQKSTKTRSGRT